MPADPDQLQRGQDAQIPSTMVELDWRREVLALLRFLPLVALLSAMLIRLLRFFPRSGSALLVVVPVSLLTPGFARRSVGIIVPRACTQLGVSALV